MHRGSRALRSRFVVLKPMRMLVYRWLVCLAWASSSWACGAPASPAADDAGPRRDGGPAPRDGGHDAGELTVEEDAGGSAAVLRIYWVDTEGGAATVLVAPSGEVILVDAGNPGGRDAGRIVTLLRDEVGTSRIDALITTHYHGDHVGGVPEVASRLEVMRFYDHGDTVETTPGARDLYDAYLDVAAGRRTTITAGDALDFGALHLRFVSANGELVDAAPGLAPNPHCDGTSAPSSPTEENAMSIGFVASFGAFDFLDLGDLTRSREYQLACPVNRVGVVDLLQTTHHGLDSSNTPELVHAVDPLLVVTNNGATKGGAASVYDTLRAGASLSALFQLHRAENNDADHNPDPTLIANLDDGASDQGFFVSAEITADGQITVTNARTGVTRQASSR